jgi:hypothetical protein
MNLKILQASNLYWLLIGESISQFRTCYAFLCHATTIPYLTKAEIILMIVIDLATYFITKLIFKFQL